MKPTSIFHIDAYGGRDRGRDLDEFCGVGICCLTTGEYSMVRFTPAQRRMAHVTKSYSTKILDPGVYLRQLPPRGGALSVHGL